MTSSMRPSVVLDTPPSTSMRARIAERAARGPRNVAANPSERVGQTLPRPRVRRRGSRDARTAEGPPAIGAAKLELFFLQTCASVGKAIGILRADVGDDAFVRFACV
jgi:hypothetical protein